MKREDKTQAYGEWHWTYSWERYNKYAKSWDFWVELLPRIFFYRNRRDIKILISWIFWGLRIEHKQSLSF